MRLPERLAHAVRSPLAILMTVLSLAVLGWGIFQLQEQLQGGGGRVYENPSCIPETLPSCQGRSDVFPLLAGSRLAWTLDDPYGPELTGEVGRFAPPDIAAVHAVYYPMPMLVLVTPFAVLPYAWGATLFTWVMTFGFAALLGVAMRFASAGRIPWGIALGGSAWLVAASAPFRGASYLQQPALLVAVLQVALCLAILRGGWRWAGVLAALVLVKPQFGFVPAVVALTVIVLADRTRRGLIAFGITLAAMAVTSFVLVPSWLGGFRDQLNAYAGGGARLSVLDGMSVPAPVIVLGGLACVAALLFGAFRGRIGTVTAPVGVDLAMLVVGAIAVSLLAIPRLDPLIGPYDHLYLLIPVALLTGRAFLGGARWITMGVVALAVPLWAIIGRDYLASHDWGTNLLLRVQTAIDFAPPDGFRYALNIADYYLQSWAQFVVLVLALACAVPGIRRAGEALRSRRLSAGDESPSRGA